MCVMQADASLLSSIIMVQDLLIESQRPRSHPVHVVGVVRCPQTVKVANYMVKDLSQGTMTAELLQPDELVSGLMAQVQLHFHFYKLTTASPLLLPAYNVKKNLQHNSFSLQLFTQQIQQVFCMVVCCCVSLLRLLPRHVACGLTRLPFE